MAEIILIVHVLLALSILALVLLQQGKGADIGAAFGAGSSNTLFGSAGSVSFLFKLTAVLAIGFLATSITLDIMVAHQHRHGNVISVNAPSHSASAPSQMTLTIKPKHSTK